MAAQATLAVAVEFVGRRRAQNLLELADVASGLKVPIGFLIAFGLVHQFGVDQPA